MPSMYYYRFYYKKEVEKMEIGEFQRSKRRILWYLLCDCNISSVPSPTTRLHLCKSLSYPLLGLEINNNLHEFNNSIIRSRERVLDSGDGFTVEGTRKILIHEGGLN